MKCAVTEIQYNTCIEYSTVCSITNSRMLTPDNQSINQAISKSDRQTVGRGQSINQSPNQLSNQSHSQPITQT